MFPKHSNLNKGSALRRVFVLLRASVMAGLTPNKVTLNNQKVQPFEGRLVLLEKCR